MEIRKRAYIAIFLIFMLAIGLFASTGIFYKNINKIENEAKVYDLIGKTLEEISSGFWKLRTIFAENGSYDFSLHKEVMEKFSKMENLFNEINVTDENSKEMLDQYNYLKTYLRQYKNRTEELRKIREEMDFIDTRLDSIYSSVALYMLYIRNSIPLELFHILGRSYTNYRVIKNKENFLVLKNAIDIINQEIVDREDMVIARESLKSLKNALEEDFLFFQNIKGVKFQLNYLTSRFEKFLSLLEESTEKLISTTMQVLSRKRESIMFLYLIFVVVIIAVFISYIFLFLRRMLLSIGNLSKVVKEVEKGNLKIRFSSDSKDEISKFGSTLNEMLDYIEKITYKLKQEKEKVKRADVLKGEFIKIISHELRTPLNSVIGFSEVLSDTDLSKNQREYLNIIKAQSEKLRDILNVMLDFSFLEQVLSNEKMERFSLIATIEDVIDKNIKKATKKNLSIRFISKVDVPEILLGNPHVVFKIFDALLDNGVKFTQKGYIEVGITRKRLENDKYVFYFYVKDTGIGIPEEKKEEIFESFHQAEPTLTRRYSGMGIGLAMVKRLVESAEGRIWVKSTPGEGSTFYFILKFKAL